MTDTVKEAQLLYKDSMDATFEQRKQILEDMQFSDPSNPDQWDQDIKRQRENDPGGKRPCYVFDQCNQYVQNVTGQVEKQPPAIHAVPVGGGADKRTAEQIDGRFRHIENESRAQQHYRTAMMGAARVGVGHIIVRPALINEGLGYQEPRIGSQPDALRVVLDPWSKELDGSDLDFGYILTSVSFANYERKWGTKRAKRSFGDDGATTQDDQQKSVIVAEQWVKETKERHIQAWTDPNGEECSGTLEEYWAACQKAGVQLERLGDPKKESYRQVKWRLMDGDDVLDTLKDADGKEMPWPSDYIGIVPVYGYVGFKNGRINYCGIPRRARAPQQAYNYHGSEMKAYIATAPRSPWTVPVRAVIGLEALWDRASIESRAYLPYNDIDENGNAIAAPNRTPMNLDMRAHADGAAQALRDIQASIGMYQANIGANSNVTSGVAYDSQKQQGESSTAHFPSHLSDSVGQVGRIVLQMDTRLCDTKRKMTVVGMDQSVSQIYSDPEQEAPYAQEGDDICINTGKGDYGVRVTVGASYATQRKETNAMFTEMLRANKEVAPVIMPFWAQTLDFPGADKFAQAVAAMAPPPIKAILTPEGGKQPDAAALTAEIDQMKQKMQEMMAIGQETHSELEEKDEELQKANLKLADKEQENDIKSYEAETRRLQVTGANDEQIKAITRELIEDMLRSPTPLHGEEVGENGEAITSKAMPAQEMPVESMEGQPEGMEPPGQPEPAPLAPEVQALIDGQQALTQAVMQMIELSSKPRITKAERDPKTREILHTVQTLQ